MISTTTRSSLALSSSLSYRKIYDIGRTPLTGRFETRATDQKPVNIFLLRQVAAVLLAHATAVDDTRSRRGFSGDFGGQPVADGGVHLLRLGGCSDFAGANGPGKG